MADVYMKSKFYFKRGQSADWTSQNPTLGPGEPGFELDTGKLKVGNGKTPWNELEYITDKDNLPENLIDYVGSVSVLPTVANGGDICEKDGEFYIRTDKEWKKLSGENSTGIVEVIKIRSNETTNQVAEINGVQYASFDEAVAAANDGDLIILSASYNDAINVPAGKTIGIQLNNLTMAQPITVAQGANVSISGDGTISGADSFVIDNAGTLTLLGGTYTSTSNSVINNSGSLVIGGGVYGLDSSELPIINNSGILEIESGSFIGGSCALTGGAIAGGIFNSSLPTTGNIFISGGKFINEVASEFIATGHTQVYRDGYYVIE